jgi:S-adenosylmethionine hydrolase
MVHPLITLTTDFGLKDPYVAEMKAVILRTCPDATVVDVSHEVDKFNVRMGAFILAAAAPYFPINTVHVAVVDPGVGTKRRGICIETDRACYVGPDNGLLVLAAQAQGIRHAYEIENKKLMMSEVSSTFHGRDIFASAAGHLANGLSPSSFGPEIAKFVVPKFAGPVRRKGAIAGEVIHVDDFGNIITNIRYGELENMGVGRPVKTRLKEGEVKMPFCRAYGEVEAGKPLALIGSHGFLEIAINRGNAASVFRIKNGDTVMIYRS